MSGDGDSNGNVDGLEMFAVSMVCYVQRLISQREWQT